MVQAAPHEVANLKDGSEKEAIEFRRAFLAANQKQRHIVVLINSATLRKAEALIKTCEHCNEEGTEFPFVLILDRITGSDPKVTDYVLETPARCPSCFCDVWLANSKFRPESDVFFSCTIRRCAT
jgi:hypothetical protein